MSHARDRSSATNVSPIARRPALHRFFVPITAKDRLAGRKALGRLGGLVDDIVTRSGLDEDELVQEISPKRRMR